LIAYSAQSDNNKTPAELKKRLRDLIQHELGGSHLGGRASDRGRDAQPQAALDALTTSTVQLLRDKDEVGLRELARSQRRAFQMRARSSIHKHSATGDLVAFDDEITPALDRYLAYILPLVDHFSPLVRDELRVLGRLNGEAFLDSGPTVWVRMPAWLVWWMTYTIGAIAVSAENLQALRGLFETRLSGRAAAARPMALALPEVGGQALATEQLAPESYWDPPFIYLARRLRASPLMQMRYPELTDDGGIEKRLADFSFLATLLAGNLGKPIVASWTGRTDGAVEITERLSEDHAFRGAIADLFDLPVEVFEREAPLWLDSILREGTIPGGIIASPARLEFGGSVVWEGFEPTGETVTCCLGLKALGRSTPRVIFALSVLCRQLRGRPSVAAKDTSSSDVKVRARPRSGLLYITSA
jgi:hypothetical protein